MLSIGLPEGSMPKWSSRCPRAIGSQCAFSDAPKAYSSLAFSGSPQYASENRTTTSFAFQSTEISLVQSRADPSTRISSICSDSLGYASGISSGLNHTSPSMVGNDAHPSKVRT